ncbi:MAG: hypothetical protein AAGL17_14365, partial [Cyanobacteria bacterium J06576_12]
TELLAKVSSGFARTPESAVARTPLLQRSVIARSAELAAANQSSLALQPTAQLSETTPSVK